MGSPMDMTFGANALPIGASLIVSIRKNTISVPWSVKHQNLKFRQMVEKPERLRSICRRKASHHQAHVYPPSILSFVGQEAYVFFHRHLIQRVRAAAVSGPGLKSE